MLVTVLRFPPVAIVVVVAVDRSCSLSAFVSPGWVHAVNAALARVHANHWQARDLCFCGVKGSLHFKKKTLNFFGISNPYKKKSLNFLGQGTGQLSFMYKVFILKRIISIPKCPCTSAFAQALVFLSLPVWRPPIASTSTPSSTC